LPNVVNRNATDAQNKLESVGLTFKASGDTSGTVVQSQSPSANKIVKSGTTVTCTF